MSKLFDALTRLLLEKYPADWLNQLGLLHGEPVQMMNSDQSPGGRYRGEFCYHLVSVWQWGTDAILEAGIGFLPLAPLSARNVDDVPIIVDRSKERVDSSAVTAKISELWTSAAIIAGLRFPWELIKHCFEGITAMRESSTIQAFIEEGRVKGLAEGKAEGRAEGVRQIILRQGRIRFGEPDATVRFRLNAISDLEKLQQLGDRLVIVSSWDELLNEESL